MNSMIMASIMVLLKIAYGTKVIEYTKELIKDVADKDMSSEDKKKQVIQGLMDISSEVYKIVSGLSNTSINAMVEDTLLSLKINKEVK